MTDQNQTPDVPEEESKELAYQKMEGEWEYNPFAFQANIDINGRRLPLWLQARNRNDHDALSARAPELYGKKFYAAIRNNGFGLTPGTVIRVTHLADRGLEVDIDWIKAVAYADPEQDHTVIQPNRPLVPEVVNEVKGEMRANDGKLDTREFLQNYFGD